MRALYLTYAMTMGRLAHYAVVLTISVALLGQAAFAQSDGHYNMFGTVGLIDMPSAQTAPDAALAATVSRFTGTKRTTLSFQISPHLSGSFRYSSLKNASEIGGTGLFDRSFDLQYQITTESGYGPGIAIELRDFIGTGVYSSEYLVATKQVSPTVAMTGGIGWGRLGSARGFMNPLSGLGGRFENRPAGFNGTGGQVESARWFRGDAALFGGVAWEPSKALRLVAEYSSDAYLPERIATRAHFNPASQLNFGLSYNILPDTTLQAHYLYGSELGVGLTFALNPKEPVAFGGTGQRPTPVVARLPGEEHERGWVHHVDTAGVVRDGVKRLLVFEGMTLEAMNLQLTSVTVLFRNDTYLASAEALGRTARILTRVVPASVEDFHLVPVANGVSAAAIHLRRSDIEKLEFANENAALIYERTVITDPVRFSAPLLSDPYPRFMWQLVPYISASYFDPDSPVRADVGLSLSGRYDIFRGFALSGMLRKPLAGNIGEGRHSHSILEPVRTNSALYAANGNPAITRLTARYQSNISEGYYGRITAGYLEPMFGGLSAEVLWKPVHSKLGLGLGVELNYARQRDFDQQLGFQDYDVITGHASAYYAITRDFHAQIDVGRYLAGDLGATFSVERRFHNGWRVGAFATLTDVPFDDFGEGSFDKGLRFSIPIEHFFGTPSNRVNSITLRPLTRDGGARLNLADRLYETVEPYHDHSLQSTWGRFWR